MAIRKQIETSLATFLTRDAISIVLPYCYPLWIPDQYYSDETLCFLYLYVPLMHAKSHPLLQRVKRVRTMFTRQRQRYEELVRPVLEPWLWNGILNGWGRVSKEKLGRVIEVELLAYLLRPYNVNELEKKQASELNIRYINSNVAMDKSSLPPRIRLVRIHRALRLVKRFVSRWRKRRFAGSLSVNFTRRDDCQGCVIL